MINEKFNVYITSNILDYAKELTILAVSADS